MQPTKSSMEGIKAVGIAANAYQCLEYISKIINHGRGRRKRGFVTANVDDDTTELKSSIGKLAGYSSRSTASVEPSILTMATDSVRLAEETMTKVSAMKPNKSKSTWKAIKVAVLPNAESHQLDELDRHVQHYRSQCEVQLLQNIR